MFIIIVFVSYFKYYFMYKTIYFLKQNIRRIFDSIFLSFFPGIHILENLWKQSLSSIAHIYFKLFFTVCTLIVPSITTFWYIFFHWLNILLSCPSLHQSHHLYKEHSVQNYAFLCWQKLLEKLKREGEEDHNDAFILVILSYGGVGTVMCTDGREVPLRDIINVFTTENCPNLKNKPKLFFIQACGTKYNGITVWNLKFQFKYSHDQMKVWF